MTPHPKTPSAGDLLIGSKIRELRTLRGMSQSALAEKLGITFQQIQKYEKGTNRIAGSRIATAAQALGVDPAVLLGAASAAPEAAPLPPMDHAVRDVVVLMLAQPPRVRSAIRTLVSGVAASIAEASGAAEAAE
jgi:transcriptional regulator with XRE-family HTH domain